MDELIEARYINEKKDYGVFAKIDIKSKTLIGEYIG